MIFIGVDPGQSGGIASIDETTGPDGNGERVVRAVAMPKTERDILEEFWFLARSDGQQRAMIEKVHAFPAKPKKGERGSGQGVSSAFKFGMNYGFLRASLIASEIPFEDVLPQKWQREFGLVFPRARNLTITEKKNFHKQAAQQLFPRMTITHAIADALLIAEYLRRREKH